MDRSKDMEFNRIVDCLIKNNDLDVLLDSIPDKTKTKFINDWNEGQE